MRFELPRVYPITDTLLSGLSHAEQVKRLISGGATLIQLREKHSSPREFYVDARAALITARESNVRLVINDRADIALALKGIASGEEAARFGGIDPVTWAHSRVYFMESLEAEVARAKRFGRER